MNAIRIAAAQTAEYRGDIDRAVACIVEFLGKARDSGAKLICFPEGFLQGYLTDESSARRVALDLTSPAFRSILRRLPTAGPTMVIGMIEVEHGRLFNSAVVVAEGRVLGKYRKVHLLPGERAFDAGSDAQTFDVDGLRFGINICYDTNFPDAARGVAERGAALIVCPANNMLPLDRAERFRDLHNAARGARCRETGLWLISADVTGERSGWAAWGPTAVLGPDGEVKAQLPLGSPGLLVFDLPRGDERSYASGLTSEPAAGPEPAARP